MLVTRFGRVSDLIVLRQLVPGLIQTQHAFDAAVFGSDRPVLIVPEKLPFDMTDHIMIAWNGSLEASRAVLGAMPLLHLANRVSIFAAPQYDTEGVDPTDLAEALSWQGIRAHAVAAPANGYSTGAALVAAVTKQEATLIVMGAYTHSRLRQSFLGGVTKHLPHACPDPAADGPLRVGRGTSGCGIMVGAPAPPGSPGAARRRCSVLPARRQDCPRHRADPIVRRDPQRDFGLRQDRGAVAQGHETLTDMRRSGVLDRTVLVFGQMNEPPGTRWRVGMRMPVVGA